MKRRLSLFILLLTNTLWATPPVGPIPGNGAGNGGFAYVRRDHDTRQILEVRFHDLWWGENELDLKIVRRNVPAEQQARELVTRLLQLDEQAFADVANELNRIIRQKKVLKDGITLLEPDDLYKHIVPEPGTDAEVVALVNWTDDDAILVRRDLWTFLSNPLQAQTDEQTDIAAMYVHEALWKAIRNRPQPKPPTSKEAAAIVAYGFSDYSDDQFAEWYKNFRKTGQLKLPDPVQELRLEEGIYGETFGDGTKEANLARSRKSWEARCKQWQADVTRQLTPVSEYVYALCRESKESHPIDKVAYSVYSNGLIITKPKKIYAKLTEWIRGRMIPLTVSTGYPQWYSNLSHEERCAKWKEEVKQRLGDRFVYANCGMEVLDEPNVFDYFESRGGSTVPHYKLLAELTGSVGTVIAFAPPTLTSDHEKIEGTLYGYDLSNADQAMIATNDSWEEACAKFKAKYNAPDVLYATCDSEDVPRNIPEPVRKSDGRVQMTSTGTIYRLPAKPVSHGK